MEKQSQVPPRSGRIADDQRMLVGFTSSFKRGIVLRSFIGIQFEGVCKSQQWPTLFNTGLTEVQKGVGIGLLHLICLLASKAVSM